MINPIFDRNKKKNEKEHITKEEMAITRPDELALIDYPSRLTEEGKVYFIKGLNTFFDKANAIIDFKVKDMSMEDQDEEMAYEQVGMKSNCLIYDNDMGPLPLITYNYRCDLIDAAIDYVQTDKDPTDIGLYRHLVKDLKPMDYQEQTLSQIQDEYESPELDPENLPNVIRLGNGNYQVPKKTESNDIRAMHIPIIKDIFTLYRTSQYNTLVFPEEKNLFLHALRLSKDFNYDFNLGFKQRAVYDYTAEQRSEIEEAVCGMSTEEACRKNIGIFASFHMNYMAFHKNEDNAYSYNMALRMDQLYQRSRALHYCMYGETENFIDYFGQLTNDPLYVVSFPDKKYNRYQDIKGSEARMTLATFQKGDRVCFGYEDITALYATFSPSNKKALDRKFQEMLDDFTNEKNWPTISLAEYCQQRIAFAEPSVKTEIRPGKAPATLPIQPN